MSCTFGSVLLTLLLFGGHCLQSVLSSGWDSSQKDPWALHLFIPSVFGQAPQGPWVKLRVVGLNRCAGGLTSVSSKGPKPQTPQPER
jgi:hypothetical protein